MLRRSARYFAVVGISFFGATSFGQTNPAGATWNQWTREKKAIYLLGWVDGRQSGAYDAVQMFKPELMKKFFDPKSPTQKLFPPTITVGQLSSGADKFYGDYRNLHIDIRSAVDLIFDDIRGKRPLTEEYLKQIRKTAADGQ